MFKICKRRKRGRLSATLLTRKELEQTTDIFFADSDMNDLIAYHGNEACIMTENDKFVGTTAKFSADGTIVSLRPDLRPSTSVTHFPSN